MTTPLEFAKQALAGQPFSVFIGAEITDFTEGRAELRIPMRNELKQQNGFAHGGVVSYAADNALTFVAAGALGTGIVTSEYKINYLRPAIGDAIIARATIVYASKSQAVCRCDVFVADREGERLCAVAQGTISRIADPSSANR